MRSPHKRERHERRRERSYLALALVIFALALILRLVPLEEYHGWDESTYLQHAERIAFGKSNYDELAFRPPLLPLLFAGALRIWHSPFAASIVVALLSASLTLALFAIGRRLHSPHAGLFAALLGAVHPLFVQNGHLLLTDAVVASLLAFSLLLALRPQWWAPLGAGAMLGLAGLTKFSGLGAVPPLMLLVMVVAWSSSRQHRAGRALGAGALFAAGAALVLSPYLWWAQQRYGSFLIVFERAQAIVNVAHGGPLFYLSLVIFTLPILFGIALVTWSLIQRHERGIMLFAGLALVWATIILGYLNTFPNREYRYALPAIVPLLALAGIGYAELIASRPWARASARAGAQGIKARHQLGSEARPQTRPDLLSHAPALIAVALILSLSSDSFSHVTGPLVESRPEPAVELALRVRALNTSMPIYATSDYPIYGYYTDNKVVVVDGPRFLDAYPRNMPRDGYLILDKQRWRDPTVGWADSQRELQRIFENEYTIVYAYDNPRYP